MYSQIVNSMSILFPWYYHRNSKHLLSIYPSQQSYYVLYMYFFVYSLLLIQLDEIRVLLLSSFTDVDTELIVCKYLANKAIQVINGEARAQNKAV